MTDRELDEILTFWWPRVLRRAMGGTDEWPKTFARSIARQAKRIAWTPTPKQAHLMRQMVQELRSTPEDDIDLIEDDADNAEGDAGVLRVRAAFQRAESVTLPASMEGATDKR